MQTLENRISELRRKTNFSWNLFTILTRKLYGRSSEKTSVLISGQLSFFNEAETEADSKAKEPDLKQVESYQRKRFDGQRMEFLKDLPATCIKRYRYLPDNEI
ncbi:MAG: hypothetical protein FNP40_03055 [Dehalobacter sp. 4CP]|uniref:transposase domain-containing protein n=1 Tax=Dehalobacter sp. CP TaxID=2594474 RepID=UPI0013CC1C6B|nr:hypothetical protein [Dehalobacter sp. 4CP]